MEDYCEDDAFEGYSGQNSSEDSENRETFGDLQEMRLLPEEPRGGESRSSFFDFELPDQSSIEEIRLNQRRALEMDERVNEEDKGSANSSPAIELQDSSGRKGPDKCMSKSEDSQKDRQFDNSSYKSSQFDDSLLFESLMEKLPSSTLLDSSEHEKLSIASPRHHTIFNDDADMETLLKLGTKELYEFFEVDDDEDDENELVRPPSILDQSFSQQNAYQPIEKCMFIAKTDHTVDNNDRYPQQHFLSIAPTDLCQTQHVPLQYPSYPQHQEPQPVPEQEASSTIIDVLFSSTDKKDQTNVVPATIHPDSLFSRGQSPTQSWQEPWMQDPSQQTPDTTPHAESCPPQKPPTPNPEKAPLPEEPSKDRKSYNRRPTWRKSSRRMKAHEIESLIRMQEYQLHTDNPWIDNYYQNNQELLSNPSGYRFHRPLCDPPRSQRKRKESDNSLGRITFQTPRAPRQVIDLDPPPPYQRPNPIPLNTYAIHLLIENVYETLLKLEDLHQLEKCLSNKQQPPSNTLRTPLTQSDIHAKKQPLFSVILSLLDVPPIDSPNSSTHTTYSDWENFMLRLISIPKGSRLISRLLPLLPSSISLSLLKFFIRHLFPLSSFTIQHHESKPYVSAIFNYTRLVVLASSPELFSQILQLFEFHHHFTSSRLLSILRTKSGILLYLSLFQRAYQLLRYENHSSLLNSWEQFHSAVLLSLSGHLLQLCQPPGGDSPLPDHSSPLQTIEFLCYLCIFANPQQKAYLSTELAPELTPRNDEAPDLAKARALLTSFASFKETHCP
ncbi:uncharacterized protein LOC126314436 [Schistocerca gregaria]|uniref:uncharacterized protein LOC126314436 n=1 Tax=Schistocerca gregaria TaxID=7010 RepID=UPI00211DFBEB|nr:uncharacterized protein LOC126314436 [Schistocerca gregaria]